MIALLFTDVEGSTRLASRVPVAYKQAIARHFEILRHCLAAHGGQEFLENGDGLLLAFVEAEDAAAFAVDAQKCLSLEEWPAEVGALRVRMALHTGEAEFRDGQYRGLAMNLTARLLAAAHGGQVLCSAAAASTLGDCSPTPLRTMGVYRLRSFEHTEEISELLWRCDLAFRQLRAEYARSHNLPMLQTPIIGRDAERAELAAGLTLGTRQTRLVTLTGPGGIGKTRLAVAAAYDFLEVFDHAVTLVSLAEIDRPNRITEAVRHALRIPAQPSLTDLDQIREALGSAPVLLVLDNMEHLLPEGAARILSLLRQIPNLRCIATSRIALGLPGEWVFPVTPLATTASGDLPDSLSASEELFILRSREARPEFRRTAVNRSSINELCTLLEGVPLAIELAAARTSVLSPQRILEQIADRFTFLQDQAGGHPERHFSLEAAVSWSFDALPPKSQEVLAALSVFRGGCTLEAAIQVAGDGSPEETAAALQNLRFCSLLIAEEGLADLRFRMLETIRQYAADRLGSSLGNIQDRHWRHFSILAYNMETQMQQEVDPAWLDQLDEEHLNFQYVLANASTSIRRLRLATALRRFWMIRGYSRENRHWLTRLPECSDVRERTVVANAFYAAGLLDLCLGRLSRARICYERALFAFRELGIEKNIAGVLNNLGSVVYQQGNYKLAQKYYFECMKACERLGATDELATSLAMLGTCFLEDRDLSTARIHLDHSANLIQGSKDHVTFALILQNLGYLEFLSGNLERARCHYIESYDIHRELKMASSLPGLFISFAQLADRFGHFEASARLIIVAKALTKKLGQRLPIRLKADCLDLEEKAYQALGEKMLQRIFNEIERLSLADLIKIDIYLA